jgi:hypothetical protein
LKQEDAVFDHKIHTRNGVEIAEVVSIERPIANPQDFLDMAGNIPTRRIILRKELLSETFFDLSSRIAGEILQKVSNYGMQLAIVGDFTKYVSKSLRDFIYESNITGQVVFVATLEKALDRLSI